MTLHEFDVISLDSIKAAQIFNTYPVTILLGQFMKEKLQCFGILHKQR